MSRYLLKLSGEALIGQYDHGIDHKVLNDISSDIVSVANKGHELAIVVGGGNIFRGARLAQTGIDRVTGDNIGMVLCKENSIPLRIFNVTMKNSISKVIVDESIGTKVTT